MRAEELQQWAALLSWLEAAGVDAATDEGARDWRRAAAVPVAAPVAAPAERRPAAPAPAPARRSGPMTTLIGDAAVGDARMLAAAAGSLEELAAALDAFDGCALKATASRLVFADGDPAAPIMAIGEAPGGDEDRTGTPFVGRAGQLLDRMLATIGLDRRLVYITNIVTWRPPGNRKPNQAELAVCLPFCHRHIALKQPRLVLLLGGTAASALAGTTEGITRLRGRWLDLAVPGIEETLPAMAVFHPAYLLRTPAAKRQAWRDLRAIDRRLAEMGIETGPVAWRGP